VSDAPLFIGWQARVPRGLRRFLALVAASLLAGAVVLAVLLARAADDPGAGDWAGDATLTGTLTARPYPLLRLPDGHTVLLSAFGKAQVAVPADGAPRAVTAGGVLVRRGTLDMLVVNDPARLRLSDAHAAPPPATPLGRWRIVGEICDGKCYTGAMRPGAGIAHRACASLCLIGDIPPVLVGVAPAEGSSFFLLAGPDGGPMPAALRKLVGLRLRLDGLLERRGDLLVFRADPASAEVM
jgi:hypothetical protein